MVEQKNIMNLYERIENIQSYIMDLSDAILVIGQGLSALYGEADEAVQSCLSVIRIGLETIGSEKIAELQETIEGFMQECV